MFGYQIADFLAWDRQIWLDLVAAYQTGWWPMPWLWLVALFAAFWLGLRHRSGVSASGSDHVERFRVLAPAPLLVVLAAAWLWVGSMFHGREHASLNWAAHYWMWGCWLQAVLMLLGALLMRGLRNRVALQAGSQSGPQRGSQGAPVVAMTRYRALLLALGLFAPPLAALLLDQQAPGYGEWPGMTTGATALASLLVLALPAGRAARGSVSAGQRGALMVAMMLPLLLLVQEAAFGQVLGLSTPLALLVLALSGSLALGLGGYRGPRP